MLSHLCKSCRQIVSSQVIPRIHTVMFSVPASRFSSGQRSWKTLASITGTQKGKSSETKWQKDKTTSNWEVDIEKLIRSSTQISETDSHRTQNVKQSNVEQNNRRPNIKLPQKERYSGAKTPPWLKDIHSELFKYVVLPSPNRVVRGKQQKELQAMSTADLLAMACSVKLVDKDSMKLVVALWRRLNSMTVEEMLTAADIFYLQGVSVPWYSSALISYTDEMFESLTFTPHQLSRLTFHISQHGSAPPSLLDAVEGRMRETLSDFNINLIAIMCHLLFVGQNRMKSLILVDQIANRLLQEVDSVSSVFIPMLMKMFRFSNFIKVNFYKELGDQLVASGYLQQLSKPSQVMHFAFTYAAVRITHPDLFEHILAHCKARPTQYRLKDLAKIIWACGTLVTNETRHVQLIQGILEHLRTDTVLSQIQEYPDNMMDLLMGLALLNIYPYDLINMIFDPSIVQKLLGLNHEREKFLQMEFLHESLSMECPDYRGHILSQKDRALVAQRLEILSLDVDMKFRKSVAPAVAALEQAFGQGTVQCKFALPHFRTSDILLIFDDQQKCFVNQEQLSPSDSCTPASEPQLTRVVILLLSLAQTSYDNQPLGMLHCKIRQLSALGYKVITVDAHEAQSYTCQDLMSTQNALLAHLSQALGTDVIKRVRSSGES